MLTPDFSKTPIPYFALYKRYESFDRALKLPLTVRRDNMLAFEIKFSIRFSVYLFFLPIALIDNKKEETNQCSMNY